MNITERKRGFPVESIEARKSWLLPPSALKIINDQYQDSWAPASKRSIENGRSFESIEKAMWMKLFGTKKRTLDILQKRIEAVVKQNQVFHILDVGSGSYATSFTGVTFESLETNEDRSFTQEKGITKKYIGLKEILESWGYQAEKHFEMLSVHGGSFVIPQQPGLKLITANIFNKIPDVPDGSIHFLYSFNTVYQTFGGLYLLEYFDRLLAKSKNKTKSGIGIVWPLEDSNDQFILIDKNQKALNYEILFQNFKNLDYWHEGRHVAWIKENEGNLCFPIKPFALITTQIFQELSLDRMVYQVDTSSLEDGNKSNIIYHENPDILDNLISRSKNVEYF